MKLSDFKGVEAVKLMGKLIGIFGQFFSNEEVKKIYDEKAEGWVKSLLETSLEVCPDSWLDLYMALNPDITTPKEEVSIIDVFIFATGVMNDKELMELFFSQGKTVRKTSTGLATENTEV